EQLGAAMNMIAIPHREKIVSIKPDYIERLLVQSQAVYCVIDPIIAFAGGKSTDRASEVRSFIGPLVHVAESLGVAIVLTLHLNKASGNRALYRSQGSIDFPAICRSVFAFAIDKDGRRLMAHVKNSLSAKQKTLEYFLNENGFSWGDESDETADDSLVSADHRHGKAAEKLEGAKAFLIEELLNGWKRSEDLEKAAIKKGISRRTVWRAKAGVKNKSLTQGGAVE